MRPLSLGNTILILLPVAASLSCTKSEETLRFEYPRLEVSSEMVEFSAVELEGTTTRTVWVSNLGDLPMGVTDIVVTTDDDGDGAGEHFSVAYSSADIECPEGSDTGEAEGKDFAVDTGGPGDTDTPSDTGDLPADDGDVLILDPDCRVPVYTTFQPRNLGTLWDALLVVTDTEDIGDATGDPSYYADPIRTKRLVYLNGEGESGVQNVLVQPRRYDYGHLWTGTSEAAYITVRNSGTGDLLLHEPTLDDCPETFQITALGEEGAEVVLGPGVSTFVEVTYSPEDTDASECTLIIETDDEDTPRVDVSLEANTGSDPENVPATVIIRSPGVGHVWSGNEEQSLTLELNIFDVNQPADSLTCRVKSMVKADGASVAHCEADDESGHVFVDVPFEYVENGIDTLKVQVTDSAQTISSASISVLWNDGFPESDDDGDGWGDIDDADEDGNYDCDDLNINTYPFAAEIPDGYDNDCDGVIDEGTTAYDDDGDSFSEDDGDCNDYDETVYPGGWELGDYQDNDCDGIDDEGTSLFDDDGDGYNEMDGDTDDDNASVHPGAIEYCDGIDNDCDGLRDYSDPDGCIEIDSAPYVVGGLNLTQTACEPGDAIQVSVLAYDAEGQDLEYAWTGDGDLVIAPLTGSPSVTVTCPEPDNRNGSVYSMHVYITDPDQNAVWDFDEMWVYPENDLYRPLTRIVVGDGSCSTGSVLPALSLAWLALVGAAIRRRRD